MAYVKQGKLSNYKKKYLAPNKYNKITIKTTKTESAKKLKQKEPTCESFAQVSNAQLHTYMMANADHIHTTA